MSMFAALAFGAPVGTTLYAFGGFFAVAAATILVPLITVLLVGLLPSVPAQRGARAGLMKVLAAVWLPGFGSALSSVGFGAMIAFSSLLSAERGWDPLWLTFSTFAVALVAARLFLGHTPDKLWRSQGRAGLRIHRSGRLGSDLVRDQSGSGGGRCCTHGLRLFTRLSGPRRGSRATHSAAEPRARDGRLS